MLFVLNLKAADQSFIDLTKLTTPESDEFNDVSYLHVVPQYEENMQEGRALSVEYYFGELENGAVSLDKLKIIQEVIADDKLENPNHKIDIITISPHSSIQNQDLLDDVQKRLGVASRDIHTQQLPEFLEQTTKVEKKSKRYPSALGGGRVFWTFVRLSSSAAGTFGALYFMEGLAAPMAASVAIWPGLASGGITYFSNAYGGFLTNGKWSTWLMESDSLMARGFRKGFKLNPKNLEDSLVKNRNFFAKKYPELLKKSPELFEARVVARTQESLVRSESELARILTKLKHTEEYFKWWLTEVAFVGAAIKLPQAVAGIGGTMSLGAMAGDVLMGSTMGMIAQGPGDIAIQLRKYQKVAELKEAIISGAQKFDDSKALLSEIEKVLAKTGEFKNYTINASSHKALTAIENWARSRATMLSFFSVTGVALEIAGVPAGKPILMAVGAFGIGYYANVQGWIKPSKIKEAFQRFRQKVRLGEIGFSLQFLKSRYCSAKFRYKPNSIVAP